MSHAAAKAVPLSGVSIHFPRIDPPPDGYPDGMDIRIIPSADGLAYIRLPAIIECIYDADAGSLAFRVNGGDELTAEIKFPRGAALRPWACVCNRGDEVTLVSPCWYTDGVM